MPESETQPALDAESATELDVEPVQVVAPPPADLEPPPVQVGVSDDDPSGENSDQSGLPDSLLPEGAYVVVHD